MNTLSEMSELDRQNALDSEATPELDDIAGAGRWSPIDRGLSHGALAAASTYSVTGSATSAAVIGGTAGFTVWGNSSTNDNNGFGGRVICTHFYKKGMLDRETWRADMEYTAKHLSESTVRGYQYWAIPYVKLMRTSPLAEKVMFPLAKWRATELAYQLGKTEKGSIRGKMVRALLEPCCALLGKVVKQKDWRPLWVDHAPEML